MCQGTVEEPELPGQGASRSSDDPWWYAVPMAWRAREARLMLGSLGPVLPTPGRAQIRGVGPKPYCTARLKTATTWRPQPAGVLALPREPCVGVGCWWSAGGSSFCLQGIQPTLASSRAIRYPWRHQMMFALPVTESLILLMAWQVCTNWSRTGQGDE